jgi:hypothetical protein
VAPISLGDAAAVGAMKRGLKPNVRVLSFQEKELLHKFSEQNWESKEVEEAYKCMQAVKLSEMREPEGTRTETFQQEKDWEQISFVPNPIPTMVCSVPGRAIA